MTASENEALVTCDNCHENLDTGHCVMKPYEGKMKISELMIVLMSLISNEMTIHFTIRSSLFSFLPNQKLN